MLSPFTVRDAFPATDDLLAFSLCVRVRVCLVPQPQDFVCLALLSVCPPGVVGVVVVTLLSLLLSLSPLRDSSRCCVLCCARTHVCHAACRDTSLPRPILCCILGPAKRFYLCLLLFL